MNFQRTSLLAVILAASLYNNDNQRATAFSPLSPSRDTALRYRTSDDDATTVADDSRVTPALLSRATTSASRASSRPSPVLSLESAAQFESTIADPQNEDFDKLTILRFHAPWCAVCRTTGVAYERLAVKLAKESATNSNSNANANARGIRFASVELTPKNPRASELKELFEVEGVPLGVFVRRGEVVGRVTLNRANLGELKKRLGGFVEGKMEVDGLLDGLMYSGSKEGEVKVEVEAEAKESFIIV